MDAMRLIVSAEVRQEWSGLMASVMTCGGDSVQLDLALTGDLGWHQTQKAHAADQTHRDAVSLSHYGLMSQSMTKDSNLDDLCFIGSGKQIRGQSRNWQSLDAP